MHRASISLPASSSKPAEVGPRSMVRAKGCWQAPTSDCAVCFAAGIGIFRGLGFFFGCRVRGEVAVAFSNGQAPAGRPLASNAQRQRSLQVRLREELCQAECDSIHPRCANDVIHLSSICLFICLLRKKLCGAEADPIQPRFRV